MCCGSVSRATRSVHASSASGEKERWTLVDYLDGTGCDVSYDVPLKGEFTSSRHSSSSCGEARARWPSSCMTSMSCDRRGVQSWPRAGRLVLAIAACVLAACRAPAFDAAQESCRVYSALLDSLFVREGRPLFMLQSRRPGPTYDVGMPGSDAELEADSVPPALWRRYLDDRSDSSAIPDGCIRVRSAVAWRSSAENTAMRDDESTDKRERIARSIVSVSAVVFSDDRSLALVHAWSNCGSMCAGGGIYLMRRTSGHWRLHRVVVTAVT